MTNHARYGTIQTVRKATSQHYKMKGNEIMSAVEITNKIRQLKELEDLIAEAEKEAEALKDEIKNEMLKQNTEELEVGRYIVRWTTVKSNRFDSTAFKKVMPDVYKAYTKQVTSRKFTVSG